MNDLSIGKGKKMSIAKAALIYYYETFLPYIPSIDPENNTPTLNYGHLDGLHDIVDIAGAKNMSYLTHKQVSKRLANSPYWDKEFIPGFYSGLRGHGGANVYRPSDKGKKYYEEKLKGKQF